MNKKKPIALFLTLSSLAALPASAQQLEEVVVTAQKREQSLQDVGIAVTAFGGDQLQAMGADTVQKLQDMTPNLRIKPTITGVSQYAIRGVGENADTSALSSSPVGIHVNEVAQPYPVTASNLLFDLDRVEVLRGPQGDLFGLNTTGGTINFITNRAEQEFAASFMTEVGNYDRYKVEGFVNGALTDTISARLSVSQNKRDEGWQTNVRTGADLGSFDKQGVRLSMHFEPSATFEADLELHYSKDDSDGIGMRNVSNFFVLDLLTGAADIAFSDSPAPYDGTGWTSYTRGGQIEALIGFPNTDIFSPNTRPFIDNSGFGGSLVMNWDLNDYTLTSVTGYEDFEREEYNDSDGDEYQDSGQYFGSDLELWSQELRLAFDDGGDLTWMVGANVAYDELQQTSLFIQPENVDFPGVAGQLPIQERNIWAVFGHAEWQLTEKLQFVAGLRYTEETREQTNVSTFKMGLPGDLVEILSAGVFAPAADPFDQGVPLTDADFSCFAVPLPCAPGAIGEDEIDFNEWSGKLGANYFANEALMLYASFSRGFKSGGFLDTAASNSASFQNTDAEFLNAYEIGAKGEILDGRGRLNGALFFYDYKDQQIADSIVDPLFGPLGALVNAPETEIWGAELEFAFAVTEGLTITQNIGYTTGEFKKFIGVDAEASRQTIEDPANGGLYTEVTIDRSSEELELPEWQYSGTFGYSSAISNDLMMSAVIDYSFESKVDASSRVWTDSLTGEVNDFSLPSYWLLNGRISLADAESWEVTLFGDNLLDEEYLLTYTRFNQAVVQVVGMPRTYGLRFRYDF
jgi:iron complex outermembrane recepter protein